MAYQRKLGRTASQRKALLRGLATNLINNGKIETPEAKAKEVRRIVEHLITLAVKEHENTVTVTKEFHNDKGQLVQRNQEDMMKVRNLGRKSLEEVEQKLQELGLALRPNDE